MLTHGAADTPAAQSPSDISQADPGGMRTRELGERIVLTRSAMTDMVDRPGTPGFVLRRADASDRRATMTALAPDGTLAFLHAAVHDWVVAQHFWSELSATDAVAGIADRIIRMRSGSVVDDRANDQPTRATDVVW